MQQCRETPPEEDGKGSCRAYFARLLREKAGGLARRLCFRAIGPPAVEDLLLDCIRFVQPARAPQKMCPSRKERAGDGREYSRVHHLRHYLPQIAHPLSGR